MSYAEYKYRMSEAKRRVRNGIRAGTGNSKNARRRLTLTWVLIAGYIAVAIAVYVYSLS